MNARNWSALLFWLLTLGAILPLWAFPFIPSQDGPSHLANARILERWIQGDPLHTKFFDIREEPLPNWSTQAILWVLLLIVPAAVAEKILLTGYVVGFSWTYRRLALALQPEALLLPMLGVLLCYCRCFWMGFYNYCLSMILLFGLLSILAEHRQLTWGHAFLLAYFGVLGYFTHLLGCLLMAAGSLVAIFFWHEPRWTSLGRALLAWLPGGCLVGWYLIHSGTGGSRVGSRWFHDTTAWLFSSGVLDKIEVEGSALGTQVEGPLALAMFPVGWCLLIFFLILFYVTLAKMIQAKDESPKRAPWPMLTMLVLVALAYFLGPEHLTLEQGGYLKQRFAVLLPLFLGLLLREPTHVWLRRTLLVLFLLTYAMLTVNVWQHVAEQNRDLSEFVAGREALGAGRTMFVMQPETTRVVTSDPLLHAADLYCADVGNINLDNYQAVTKHFPVRFVPGQQRGVGSFSRYPRREIVDAILVWDLPDLTRQPAFADFTLVYSGGRLKIFLRKGL